MNTKLTLKLNKDIIDKAKEYASEHNRSLSAIIEAYLKALTLSKKEEKNLPVEISSFVRSLSIKSEIPADFDYKKELGDYYTEKYK